MSSGNIRNPTNSYPSTEFAIMRQQLKKLTMEPMAKPAKNNRPLEVCIAARIVHLKYMQNDPGFQWSWNAEAKFFNKHTGQSVPDGLAMRRILHKHTDTNQDCCATKCSVRHDLIIEFEKQEWIAQTPYGYRAQNEYMTTNMRFYPRRRDTEEYKAFARDLKLHLGESDNGPWLMELRLD